MEQAQELAKIIGTDVKIVENADHNYSSSEQYNIMKNLIIEFLLKKVI